jgi:hypothetical protein
METEEISRVEGDLTTIREAVGLELPFGREDILVSLLIAAGAGFLMVWSLVLTGYWLIVGAIPVLGAVVVSTIWLAVKRRRSGRPHWEKTCTRLAT